MSKQNISAAARLQ